jgi:RimJ/RimL family protein N-acetyltransferase
MKRHLHRLRDVVRLAREGHARDVLGFMRSRLHSEFVSYGLRRDLRQPLTPPAAKIDLRVRPRASADSLSFLDPTPGSTGDAEMIRRNQLRLLAAGIPTCWIAIDPDGKPCYMQWLITSRDNARIKSQWGGVIPQLGPHEALLEGAYTPDTHRGLGIMAAAMARIAESAKELGASSVITFVAEDNVASLKGCKKAGFDPYVERRVTWRLGRRRAVFTPLPHGFRFPYEREAKEVNQPGARRDLSRSAPSAARAKSSPEAQSPPV